MQESHHPIKDNNLFLEQFVLEAQSASFLQERLQCLYWTLFPLVFSTPPLPLAAVQLEATVWNPKSLSFSAVNERLLWNASLTKTLQRWKQPREQLGFTLKPYTHKAIYFHFVVAHRNWRPLGAHFRGTAQNVLAQLAGSDMSQTGERPFCFSALSDMHHSVFISQKEEPE